MRETVGLDCGFKQQRTGLLWGVLCLLILGLSACTTEPSDKKKSFRDPKAPLGATTRFDPLRFAGTWVVVASFVPRRVSTVGVTVTPEVRHVAFTGNDIPGLAGVYREGAPGELIPVRPDRERVVVMWVDESFETAAIGAVSGRFGLVLNRTASLPADKAVAAREIFSFYGWDVSRLKSTAP